MSGEVGTTGGDPKRPRGCLPTLVIALLMAAIVGAGVVAADALSDRPPVAIEIGAGVSVIPPRAWSFVSRFEAPTGEDDGVVLTRGGGTMLVYTSDAGVTAELEALREDLGRGSLVSVGEVEATGLHPGRDGWRLGFSGALPELAATPIEGEVVGIEGSEVGVVFVAWAEVGGYQLLRAEVAQMIGRATIP